MTDRVERNRRYLNRLISRALADEEKAREALRNARIARDEFEMKQRPEYPTPEILAAVEVAVGMVERGQRPEKHGGDQVEPGVTVYGDAGYIDIRHLSPYGLAANGYLWNFTGPEIQRIRDHIESLGLKVQTDWPHERGHTFVVA